MIKIVDGCVECTFEEPELLMSSDDVEELLCIVMSKKPDNETILKMYERLYLKYKQDLED